MLICYFNMLLQSMSTYTYFTIYKTICYLMFYTIGTYIFLKFSIFEFYFIILYVQYLLFETLYWINYNTVLKARFPIFRPLVSNNNIMKVITRGFAKLCIGILNR